MSPEVSEALKNLVEAIERDEHAGVRDSFARVKAFIALYRRGLHTGETSWIYSRVYFLHAPEVDRIKIGFSSRDVGSRVQSLQTGSPVKLELLGTIVGDVQDEGALHQRWAKARIRGEWFDGSILPEVDALLEEWRPLLEDLALVYPR